MLAQNDVITSRMTFSEIFFMALAKRFKINKISFKETFGKN